MSRSKGRTSNSVSLFPFLAVLVCAMGALIFLLLVTTRRIRHNAVMQAIVAAEVQDDQPIVIPVDVPVHPPETKSEVVAIPAPSAVAAPVPQVVEQERPDPNARLEELIAALTRQRAEQQKRYDERRRLVLAAKARIADVESQQKQLAQTFKTKQEVRLSVSVDRQVKRAEFTRLGEEIDKAVVHLRRMEQENATRSSKFAVVAFDGQSGTTRRPILIECTKSGLTFMQEQITLTAAHVDGFTINQNPLLAGTQALMQYWRRQQQRGEDGQIVDSPYVLLIVRPGGSIAYYAARNMLMELAQDTGYELVEANREIAVPAADPQATAVCRKAIETILAGRQQTPNGIIAGRRGSDGVLRFKRGTGGFEPVEEEQSIYERSGQPGFGERNVGRRAGTDSRGAGNGRGNSEAPGSGRFASGGSGRFGVGRQPGGNPRTPGDGEAGRFLDPAGTGNNRTDGQPGSSSGLGRDSFAGQRGGSRGEAVGMIGRKPTDGSFPGKPGTSPGTGEGSPFRNPIAAGTGQRSDGQIGGVQPGSERENGGEPGAGVAGSLRRGGNSGQTSNGGNSDRGNGTGRGSGSADGGSSGSQSGGSAGSPQSGGPQMPMPLRTFGLANGAESPSSSLRPTSRGWGINPVRNGIGFERETTIRVTAEMIRVGTQPEIDIARFKTYDKLRERVLDDLDRHARTWGAPPKNFHWVPVVRFLVSPGGNLYYERLHGPLRKAGVSSTVEYPLDTPAPRKRTE